MQPQTLISFNIFTGVAKHMLSKPEQATFIMGKKNGASEYLDDLPRARTRWHAIVFNVLYIECEQKKNVYKLKPMCVHVICKCMRLSAYSTYSYIISFWRRGSALWHANVWFDSLIQMDINYVFALCMLLVVKKNLQRERNPFIHTFYFILFIFGHQRNSLFFRHFYLNWESDAHHYVTQIFCELKLSVGSSPLTKKTHTYTPKGTWESRIQLKSNRNVPNQIEFCIEKAILCQMPTGLKLTSA